MEAFAALGIAANIAQFVDYGVRFARLARNIRNGLDETGLEKINVYLSSLNSICSTLEARAKALGPNSKLQPADEALFALATTCRTDARAICDTFRTILPSVPDVEATLADVLEKSRKGAMKHLAHRQEHTRKAALSSVRSAFLVLWKKREIEEVFKRLDWYRTELSLRILGVVNLTADRSDDNMKILQSQNEALAQQADRHGNDIVEVVSINKSMLSTIESLAAILTRRNGETFTIPCEAGIPRNIHNEPDVSSIKFTSEGESAQEMAGNIIQKDGSAFMTRILTALHFREEDDRQDTVAEAHRRTFQWIFDVQSIDDTSNDLTEWLRSGEGCYWINGKAGSGKSTLMKYIYQQRRTYELLFQWAKAYRPKDSKLLFASFFFWNSGNNLQKSYEGMFRSLLVQIMSRRPDLVPLLFPALSRHLLSNASPNLHISLTELKAAFSKLAQVVTNDIKLFILIDGVDEFAGDHFEMSKLLFSVAKTNSIKILLSSRPIPACYQVFSKCPTLQVQNLTEGDIIYYIEDELISNESMQDMEVLEQGLSNFILGSLTEKAAGVFLWIVLVVNDLLMGLANYDSKDDLMKRIDKLPSDLEKLYDHMFKSMDAQYRSEASLLFQLVMRGRMVQKAHLTVLQLQFAEASSSAWHIPDNMFSFPPEMEAVMIKAMEGRLRSRCRGLLESQQKRKSHQRDPWVAFLHRTVQDYLNDDTIWKKVTAWNPKSLNELDELLIASCIRDMKQRRPNEGSIENWRAVLDFESCLEYSSTISRREETFHGPYCESALEILTEYCRKTESGTQVETGQSALLERWASHRLSTYDGFSRIGQDALLQSHLASTMIFAYEKLPSLFRRRVAHLRFSEDDKALLLHEFCYMASLERAEAWGAAQSAKIILDAGFDPNYPLATPVRAGASLSANLLEGTGTASPRRNIPWVFWQECVNLVNTISVAHLEITLYMLQSGAVLKAETDGQARFTAMFFSRLWGRSDTAAGATQTLLAQIRVILESNGYAIRNGKCVPLYDSTMEPSRPTTSTANPSKAKNRFSLLKIFRSDFTRHRGGD